LSQEDKELDNIDQLRQSILKKSEDEFNMIDLNVYRYMIACYRGHAYI